MAPMMLRRRVRAAVRALREATFEPPRSQQRVFELLGNSLDRDTLAVDVGANIGRWTKALLEVRPEAAVVMIEAQVELQHQLDRVADEHAGVLAVNAVLDSEARDRTFYLCHGDNHRSGSSLRRELTGARIEERSVRTTTLDALLASLALPREPQFIKLDTQGTELDILAGARQSMAVADFLQVELSLMQYNEDGPLIDEMFTFAADHGFFARDIFDFKWLPDGDLIQVDCLFAKERRAVPKLVGH